MKMNYDFNKTGFYTQVANEPDKVGFYINLKSGALRPETIVSMDGQIIEVTDCAIINFTAKDENGYPILKEDGTPKIKHRLILITPDLKSYTTASEHLFWQFINIAQVIGFPDWRDGAVKLKIKKKDLGEDKFRLDFEVM